MSVLGKIGETIGNLLNNKVDIEDFERYFKFQNWKNTISGGGDITWSGNNLSTSNKLIAVPTNANNSFLQINLTNLNIPGWNIAYIDLTDAELRKTNLMLTQDDFTVENYNSYTEATSQNRFVLGYCNHDTGEFIFSNGLTVDNMNYSDTGWINATYQNGWTSFDSSYQVARYRKIGCMVYVEGLVKDGTISNPIFTLPAGFRPEKRSVRATISNDDISRLDIDSNGSVLPVNGSNTWFSINCSFSV